MNWAKWDAEHGSGGGGVSSADKIAAQIRGALGPGKMSEPKVTSTKGKSGSTISRASEARSASAHVLKKDMKRPAPVKGQKDAADAFRTKIRMAAYNEKKKAAVAADPVNKHTPHTEEELNPHKAPDAAAHAEYKEAAAKAHKAFLATLSAAGSKDPAVHEAAAAAHKKAAQLATKSFDRGYHEKAAQQYHESAAKIKQDKQAAHSKYTDAMLTAAAATSKARAAKTAASHTKAAHAHTDAAKLATTAKEREFHNSGAAYHSQLANSYKAVATNKAVAKKVAAPLAAKKVAAPPSVRPAAKKTAAATPPPSSHTKAAEEASRTAIAHPSYVNHQKAYEAHKAAVSTTRYGVAGDDSYHQMMVGYHRFAADHPNKVIPAGINEEHKDDQAAKFPKAADHQLFSSFIDPQSRRESQDNYDSATKAHETPLTPAHKSSLAHYTSVGYIDMNGHLRKNSGNVGGASPTVTKNITNMDSAFSKQPGLESDLVTYRGTKGASNLFGQVGEKVGGEFVDHGYTSTSSHAHAAGNFGGAAGGGGALLRILHPAGSKLLTPSSVGSFGDREREMITPRGTRFHIAADRLVTMRDGKQRRVIDLVRK